MEIDFKKLGKDRGYSVPDGFFEQVSELTLRKAKQREKNHRRFQIMIGGFALAASLTAIALLGYFMTNSEKYEVRQFVKKELKQPPESIRQKEVIGKQSPFPGIKRVAEEKTHVKETTIETLSDVLAELTDDELLQMAVVYRTDPFIEESQN